MTPARDAVQERLGDLVRSIRGTVRILIVGSASHPIIDALENEARVIVEHLVFDPEELAVEKLTASGRRVYLGQATLGAQRFDLAAAFVDLVGCYAERHSISVLCSHGDAVLLLDRRATAPGQGDQQLLSLATVGAWANRRRLFLTRLLNEFGLLDIGAHELNDSRGQSGMGDEGAGTYYLARRGVYRPLLVHAHLPKTAGISMRKTLERSFPGQVLTIERDRELVGGPPTYPGHSGNGALIHALLIAHPQLAAIGSHLIRFTYPSVVADRVMLYFTFLRHPVSQFKSYVRFLKYNASLYPSGDGVFAPGSSAGMSLVEMADALMGSGTSDNRATVDDLDARYFMPCRFFGLTDQSEPVIRRLMGFLMVGIFERMQESLELLRARVAPYGMDLLVNEHPHLNPSSGANFTGEPLPADHKQQEAALEAHGAIEEFLRTRHPADFEVYDWAVANFDTQWRRFKRDSGRPRSAE